MDIDSNKAKLFAKKFNCTAFNDYKEGIDGTKSEIVSVCTPDNTHFQIVKALIEMDSNGDSLPTLESTKNYCSYIESCPENLLYAHVYVRYLGDLRGEQMIARKIPGSGKYYKFEEPKVLAESIYTKLDDSMADEAKIVFEFATKQFQELYAGHFQNSKKV